MNKGVRHRVAAIAVLSLAIVGLLGAQNSSAITPPTFTQLAAATASTDPLDPDYSEPWDSYDETNVKGCTKGGSPFGWVPCMLTSSLSSTARWAYSLIESYLSVDPEIFENSALVKGWGAIRNLANLVIFVMLLIVILSQITGFGVSNYGVKKALPRIIVVALLVNFSLILCRIAIDVMNISATAIKNAFEPLTEAAWNRVSYDPGVFGNIFGTIGSSGKILINCLLAFFGTKTFLSSGEAILNVAMFVVIAAAIGILLLAIVIVVRSALVVILTVTSPLAVILAIFPGTKRTFDRWFSMFKGVLICYPLTALMVYGGNFAGTIALSALGLNGIQVGPVFIQINVFTVMASAAASIAPIIMLPGLIIRSTGAIGATLQRFSKGLTNFLVGAASGTALAMRGRRSLNDFSNRIKAGVDRNGEENTGRLRIFRSRSEEERYDAQQRLANSRTAHRAETWITEHGVNAEGMDAEYKNYQRTLEEQGLQATKDDMTRVLDDIFGDHEKLTDNEIQSLANKLEASLDYFFGIDNKNNFEERIQRRLDELGNTNNANEIRRAVAQSRLRHGIDSLEGKAVTDYAYYHCLANEDPTAMRFHHADSRDRRWVERAVNGAGDYSFGFSAANMANYTGPTLEEIGDYMLNGSDDEVKRKIRRTYDQMLPTNALSGGAGKDDLDKIRRAIGNGAGL